MPHMTITPPYPNACFRSTLIKKLEEMKAMFTTHVYLQQLIAFQGLVLQMYFFYIQMTVLFLCIFTTT